VDCGNTGNDCGRFSKGLAIFDYCRFYGAIALTGQLSRINRYTSLAGNNLTNLDFSCFTDNDSRALNHGISIAFTEKDRAFLAAAWAHSAQFGLHDLALLDLPADIRDGIVINPCGISALANHALFTST